MKQIYFVTHNKGKVASAQDVFNKMSSNKYELKIYNQELYEPRSYDISRIAKSKTMQAYNTLKKPCFTLDTGFYIEALNGFPRTFVNFTLETIGIDGILKLMKDVENRRCYFLECLSYTEDGTNFSYANAVINGTLSNEVLGEDTNKKWSDLWYVFIPEGYQKTLAQMSEVERQKRKAKEIAKGNLSAIELFASKM